MLLVTSQTLLVKSQVISYTCKIVVQISNALVQIMRLNVCSSCKFRPRGFANTSLAFFLFGTLGHSRPSSLKLSDTRVYEPQLRARLGSTAHLCQVVSLAWGREASELGSSPTIPPTTVTESDYNHAESSLV